MPKQQLVAGGTLYRFNPFPAFKAATPIHVLVCETDPAQPTGVPRVPVDAG